MTDWRLAGRKADATRVKGLLRAAYTSPEKATIRRMVIREMRGGGATRVLDFWGGGTSAEAMTAAGLSVLSVENGSAIKTRKGEKRADGLTVARVRNAVALTAAESPYELRWGDAAAALAECDAAFLDFCGQYCRAMGDMLRAARHMKVVIVTVMPERTELGSGLTRREWELALCTLLQDASGMRLQRVTSYSRISGRAATVIVLRPDGRYGSFTAAEREREYKREYHSRPEVLERQREYKREYDSRPEVRERQREYYSRPEVRERRLARKREYERRPEVLERERKRKREYDRRPGAAERAREYMREYHSRPEVLERQREYRSRPEVRERRLERQREYYSRPEVRERTLARKREYEREHRKRKAATEASAA